MCVTKSPEVHGLISAGPKTKERGDNEKLAVIKYELSQLMGAQIADGLI